MERIVPLSPDEVIRYVKTMPGLLPASARLTASEIGNGNMNYVFRVTGQGDLETRSVIVKQALPYMRSVGASWPLTADRIRVEYETLKVQHQLCPGSVPKVLHYDKELSLIVMEDLSSHIVLRDGLNSGRRYPSFAAQIGMFLARTLFFTSSYALSATDLNYKRRTFKNPNMVKITSDFIFTFPFMNHEMNHYNPELDFIVRDIWNDTRLHDEVAGLKRAFNQDAQALIHGDLHTGSIMVTDQDTKVIDPEFAFYGPMGFDVGTLLANLLLSYFSHKINNRSEGAHNSYPMYLLKTIEKLWSNFEAEFRDLWTKHADSVASHIEHVVMQLFQDSLGFAGCEMIRRVIGTSHVLDLEQIENASERALGEALALNLGQRLILDRNAIHSIHDLTRLTRKMGEASRHDK